MSCDIKIDFCRDKKKFYFSSPLETMEGFPFRRVFGLFRLKNRPKKTEKSTESEPINSLLMSADFQTIRSYLESKCKGQLYLEKETVHFSQEIPFQSGAQMSMRRQIHQFRLSWSRSRKILSQMAIEELRQTALGTQSPGL